MTDDQKEIEGLLARRIGLDPVALGPHLVVRAVRRRMAELGLDNLGVYASRVVHSEAELQELIEEVVVPESWFFRDERPFRWLTDYVRDRWVGNPTRPLLRILSLACAGGEEPYSIAIAMRDVGLPARRVQIDAVDVSARRLAIARRGVYSANAFRGSVLGDRAHYFRAYAEGYEVEPAIRSTVRFHQASVLDPKLLDGAPPYDVVFCRNLLIYLDAAARAGVLAVLDRLLTADGVLLIGHADRLDLAGDPSRFAPAGEAGCFAYRKARGEGLRARGEPANRTGWSLLDPRPSTLDPHRVRRGTPDPARMPPEGLPGHRAGRGSPDPAHGPSEGLPEPTLDPALTQPNQVRLKAEGSRLNRSGPTRPSSFSLQPSEAKPSELLEQAAELANQGRHAEAIAMCEQHIRQKGPGPAAYYLMGMICQAAGDRRRAEDCFHKTVYLDPKHDEALLALSLLAERRGDRGAAAGFRRRASRTAATTRPEGGERR